MATIRSDSPPPDVCRGKDAKDIPAIAPLLDPPGLNSVVRALARMTVLSLPALEVRGMVAPYVVADPPPRGDEVSRMLAAQVDENPVTGLSSILSALLRVLGEARMPGASALRLDLNRDPAAITDIGSEDVDPGHVSCERHRVPTPPMDLRGDEHLPGPCDLLRIQLSSRHFLDASHKTIVARAETLVTELEAASPRTMLDAQGAWCRHRRKSTA